MSKAYLMGMLEVANPDGMGPYLEKVEETVTNHGGRYLHLSETSPQTKLCPTFLMGSARTRVLVVVRRGLLINRLLPQRTHGSRVADPVRPGCK